MCTSERPVSFGRTSRSSRSGGGSGGLGTFFDVRQANLTAVTRLSAIIVAALAIAGIPSLISGAETRFRPCADGAQACARIAGDGPLMRLQRVPGTRPVGLPDRLAVVFGASPESVPGVLRQAVLRVAAPGDVPRALEVLGRPAVVAGGPGDVTAALDAAGAPGVDGVILVDPEAGGRTPGPRLAVSMLVVASRPPARTLTDRSVRPLVLLRRSGAINDCVRRVLAGFSREPLSPRPDVTDCR